MTWTLPLNHPLALRSDDTGGKGANLAQLTKGQFNVPPGFVVVAGAYREWFQNVEWSRNAVRELPHTQPANLPKAASAIRERLHSVPLPDTIATEIRDAVSHFPAGTFFAVRSSSTMEDLADAAFAGQHDSFLNCQGTEAVLGSSQGLLPFHLA